MTLNKLAYCVQQSGYTVSHGSNVLKQELRGGPSRRRKTSTGNSHIVSVSWVVDKAGYDYLVAFFYVWEENPSKPFLALLIIDDSDLNEYACLFDSAIQLDSKEGKIFKVSATLEVQAKIRDKVLDQKIVTLGNAGLIETYPRIAPIPNEQFPRAVGVY